MERSFEILQGNNREKWNDIFDKENNNQFYRLTLILNSFIKVYSMLLLIFYPKD